MSTTISNNTDVPEDYLPYDRVDICGITLDHVTFLLEIKGYHPFLVGKGVIPYIWLSAPSAPKQDISAWRRVVERSSSKFPVVEVRISKKYKTLSVVVGNLILVDVSNFSDTDIVIKKIDLRPLGIAIFGEGDILNIAGYRHHSGSSASYSRTFMNVT